MNELENKIIAALGRIAVPDGQNIAPMISGLQVDEGHVLFSIEVDAGAGPEMENLRMEAERVVAALPGVTKVTAVLTAAKAPGDTGKKKAQIENLAPSVRHIVAVASGKGGVGKSTVAVNLAVALAASGLRVGLMDADIYGPSVPRMLGIAGKPDIVNGKVQPHAAFGLKTVSMGLMVDQEAALIWRGPMIQSALRQFLADVHWGDLDILIVDMPPGTGDAALTMAQKVPLAGAVIVSTPQDIALIDARRAITMFHQVKVPVLGIVENMSLFVCPSCGHEAHIFGHGGARDEAVKTGCDFLGEIPLTLDMRIAGDAGRPVAAGEDEAAQKFKMIAQAVASKLHLVIP